MAEAASDAGAPGPWVLVIGVHRSGTSALTGLLAGLGFALPPPGDLIEGRPDNPVHFESQALIDVNDDLLHALQGSWQAPPLLDDGWDESPTVQAFDQRTRDVLAATYKTPGGKVWKDPRLCLLLPYWSRLLAPPSPAVLIWRHPSEVADSLTRRDGFTTSRGLALWDAYTRSCLTNLAGRPTFVLRTDDLLDDPRNVAESLAEWLERQGATPGDGVGLDRERAVGAIDADLPHRAGAAARVTPPEVEDLVDLLTGLVGPHDALPNIELPPPVAWMDDLLEEQRGVSALGRGNQILSDSHHALIDEYTSLISRHNAMEAEMSLLRDEVADLRHDLSAAAEHADRVEVELNRVRSSRSWKLTSPLRKVGGRNLDEPARTPSPEPT